MRSRRLRRRALAALSALALATGLVTGCAPDAEISVDAPEQAEGSLPAETTAQLEAAVTAAIGATASSGAIVGVWAPWSGSWVTAVGTDAAGAALDVDMGFRAGDLTRLMTCDVLYSVAEDGIVALDDHISDYVVGVPDLSEVTLAQLCDGTSGIGSSQPSVQGHWIANPDRRWTPLELAAFGLGRERGVPGTAYRDSDSGYILLGMALERATQTSFAQLLRTRVFDPLGMDDTALPSTAAAVPRASGGTLPGYRLGTTPEGALDCANPIDVSRMSSSIGYSDSGVVSTVSDLGTYLRALGAGALLSDESTEQRWADPLPAYTDAPAWYSANGGGFHAGSLIGQYGWMPGYLTSGFADPETGMTVVVVLNNSTSAPGVAAYLAWQLAAITSKAPAASGFTAPEFGLPWTAEEYANSIAANALACS